MKLTTKTLEVLQNFARINTNIVISPGNEIRTRNEDKTIGARFRTEETFETEVALYSLVDFLSILKIFQDPEIEFGEKFLTISDKYGKQRYVYANKAALTFADKIPPALEYNYQFSLDKDVLARLLKATSANSFEFISFHSEGGNLSIIAGDLNKDTKEFDAASNLYTVDIDTATAESFNIAVSVADLQMLVDDYEVGIYFTEQAKLIHFFNDSIDYWIAVQKFSKFG